MIHSRLCTLWKPQGDFSLLELGNGNGFYLYKCEDEEVIEGFVGWSVGYCNVGSPASVLPKLLLIRSMCVWARIPDFPMEFLVKI